MMNRFARLFVTVLSLAMPMMASAAVWVKDPTQCPVSYQSQDCAANTYACSYSSNTLYCDTASNITAAIPAADGVGAAIPGGLNGGYVFDCVANSGSTCSTMATTGWKCESNSTCSENYRDTICDGDATTFSCSTSCQAGRLDCVGDPTEGSCNVVQNSTNYPTGANNHYGATCAAADVVCDTNYLDCDGTGEEVGNGCEIRTNYTFATNWQYTGCNGSVGAKQCVTGYLDCDASGTNVPTDDTCEIQIGAACTTGGGLPGVYDSVCQGAGVDPVCLPNKSNFETGTESGYSTSDPLLWGTQYGTGDLINFQKNGGNSFVVDNDANVGIGTTTPGAKLDVSGTFKLLTGATVNNIEETLTSSTTSIPTSAAVAAAITAGSDTDWVESGGDVYRETGNVGIGTTAPDETLHIKDDVARMLIQSTSGATGKSAVDFMSAGRAVVSSRIENYEGSLANAGTLSLQTKESTGSLTSRIFINEFGNVGIGTTTPGDKLQVQDTSSVSMLIKSTAGSAAIKADRFSDAHQARVRFDTNGVEKWNFGLIGAQTDIKNDFSILEGDASTGTPRFVVKEGGNVGIGTSSPTGKLEVQGGDIRFVSTETGEERFVFHPNTDGGAASLSIYDANEAENIRFQTNAALDSWINAGNVGIGTTTPGAKLDIAGGIRIDNNEWISARDDAGTGVVNMFRTTTDGSIEIGAPLLLGALTADTDSGAVSIFNMPVSSTPTAGTEMSASVQLDSENIFKIFAEADGTGGIQNQSVQVSGDVHAIQYCDENGANCKTVTELSDAGTDDQTLDEVLTSGNTSTQSATLGGLTVDTDTLFVDATNGRVGIGTTSPGEKLHVAGNGKFGGDVIAAQFVAGFAGTAQIITNDTDEDLTVDPNGTGDVILQPDSGDGNVGIGTTMPLAKFHVGTSPYDAGSLSDTAIIAGSATGDLNVLTLGNTASLATGNASDINFTFGSGAAETASMGAFLENSGNYKTGLTFKTHNGTSMAERMRISNLGNVGIGTMSPTAKLDILGNVDDENLLSLTKVRADDTPMLSLYTTNAARDAAMSFKTYGGKQYSLGIDASDGDKFKLSTDLTVGGTDLMTVDYAGNVGIGTTSPGAKLEIQGAYVDIKSTTSGENRLRLYGGDDGNSSQIYMYNSAQGLKNFFNSNGDSYFDGGNLGIGTTSPTAALQIKSGTATAGTAPLKFTAGTLLTTPEAGAVEWDGTNLFVTQTTGPTRKTIAYTSDITGGFVPYTGATTDVDLGAHDLTVDTDTLFVDSTNGRVGIGTTTPSRKLNVNSGHMEFTSIVKPAAMTATVVSGGTLPVQDYRYTVKFYTADGFQTEDSPGSALVTTTTGNQSVTLTNIPISSDPRVTKRKIYRSEGTYAASGDLNYLAYTIDDNTTTTITDTGWTRDTSDRGNTSPNTTSGIIFKDGKKIFQTNSNNLFAGEEAGDSTINGSFYNVFLGPSAGKTFSTTGGRNVLIGWGAGKDSVSINDAVGIGTGALMSATGTGNVAIGYSAGQSITSGENNTFLGKRAGFNALQLVTADNSIAIGNGTYTTASNQAVYGNASMAEHIFQSGNVGIGTTSPTARLQIQGKATETAGTTLLGVYSDGTLGAGGSIFKATTAGNQGLRVTEAGALSITTPTIGFAGSGNTIVSFFGVGNSHEFRSANTTQSATDWTFNAGKLTGERTDGNLFAIANNDAKKFVVDYAGNVGIGTTTPTVPLNVYKSDASAEGYAAIIDNDSYNGSGLKVVIDDTTANLNERILSLENGNGEVFGVLGSGNVGIGTITPSEKLDIVGNIAVTGTVDGVDVSDLSTTVGVNTTNITSNATNIETLQTGKADKVSGATTGNIAGLDVDGNLTDSGLALNDSGTSTTDLWSADKIDSEITTAISGIVSNSITEGDSSVTVTDTGIDGTITFATEGTTGMTIDETGNVGIGTTSPDAKLDIAINEENSNQVNYLNFTNLGSGYVDWALAKSNANDLSFINRGGAGSETDAVMTLKYVAGSGNIGIGTTNPLSKLHINGGVGSLATGLSFGDGDTGLYESADDILKLVISGSIRGTFDTTQFQYGSAAIDNSAATSTTPSLLPNAVDANTGIGRAGTDQLSLIAGGIEGIRVNTATTGVNYLDVTPSATTDAVQIATGGTDTDVDLALMPKGTGNVGIGTTTPSSKLDVNGGMNIAINNYYSTNTNPILGQVGGNFRVGYIGGNSYFQATTLDDLSLFSDGTEVLHIEGDTTNVGIGTTTPGEKLDVAGNIAVTGTVDGVDVSTLSATVTTNTAGIATNATNIATNVTGIAANVTDIATNAQNILVNTGILAVKADMVTGATAGNLAGLDGDGNLTDSGLVLNDSGSSTTDLWSANKIAAELLSATDTDWVESGGNVYRETGNVGIGTTSPDSLFEVSGASGIPSTVNSLMTLRDTSNIGFQMGATTGYGWIRAVDVGISVDNVSLILQPSGTNANVGIGTTTPDYKLQVDGDIVPETDIASTLGKAALRWGGLFSASLVDDGNSVELNNEIIVERSATAANASSSNQTILGVTDTTAARTITLATADVVDGRIIIIKDESGGASTNNITIVTEGSETIDGEASIAITADYGVLRLYSNGTNWFSF